MGIQKNKSLRTPCTHARLPPPKRNSRQGKLPPRETRLPWSLLASPRERLTTTTYSPGSELRKENGMLRKAAGKRERDQDEELRIQLYDTIERLEAHAVRARLLDDRMAELQEANQKFEKARAAAHNMGRELRRAMVYVEQLSAVLKAN